MDRLAADLVCLVTEVSLTQLQVSLILKIKALQVVLPTRFQQTVYAKK